MAAAAASAWRRAAVETREVQWQHFLELCGTWRGTWQRFAADPESKALRPVRRFEAFCVPCAAADRKSVHHVNRYPPGASPAPGRTTEQGLTEVDFGHFDQESFLAPFGPQSQAVYGPGWAAIGPSSIQDSPRLAVELVSVAAAERRRLVGLWRKVDAVAVLESATLISEDLQKDDADKLPSLREASTEAAGPVEGASRYPLEAGDGWLQLGEDAFALLPATLSPSLASDAVHAGLAWKAAGGAWKGLLVNFPDGKLAARASG
mmetsp:Transcript_176/g.418  ORF Transcript_176/g.418 Transcript_176/m.418 type:complete len:263 (+) Transcript_176:61-849(+)